MAKTEEEEETGSKVEKDTKIKTETKKETTKEEPDTNQNNPDEHKDSHTTEVYSPLLSHLHPTNIFKTEFQKRIENRITERLSHHHNKKEHEMYSFLFNNALHYEDSTIIKRRFYTDKIAKQNEPQKEETALDEDNQTNHHHHQSRKRRGRKSVSVGDVDPILFAFHHNFSAHYQNNHNHNNTNLDSFHNRFTVEDNRKYAEKVKSHLEQNESETNHIENLELDNMDICQKPFSQLTYPQQCLLTWEVQSLLHQQETIQKRVERRLISKKEREAALNRKPARMLTRRFLQEMKEKQQSEQEMHGEEELFTAAVTDATPLPGGTKQVVVDMLAEDLTEVLASDEEEEEESLSPQDDDHHNKDHTEENAPSGDTKKDFRCYYDYWKKERAFLSPVQEEK
ncbi:hypothetical protein ADEAN_000882700 [Angomonas deanei]|uniref:Uncharacterized protein n=1 Tax=Angomonas deanei TaxID=59799 RepID=A0A7G2CP72_9TRYP|nr:hypothetical protein ADEAN_000882700 [Angomonas deanei]